jgi:hypothetical protein
MRTMLLPRAASAAAVIAGLAACAPAQAAAGRGGMWRVASVKIDGTYERHHFDLESYSYTYDGTTSYQGGRSRKPFEMKLSKPAPKVILARPVTYSGASTVRYSYTEDTKEHVFDCSLQQPAAVGGLAGVLFVRPSGVTVQWSITPVGHRCPDGVAAPPPEFPTLPRRAMTERYRLDASSASARCCRSTSAGRAAACSRGTSRTSGGRGAW